LATFVVNRFYSWTVIGNCHVLIIFASREYSRKGRFFCHNKGICRRCRQ